MVLHEFSPWAPFLYVFLPLALVALALGGLRFACVASIFRICPSCGSLRRRGYPVCPQCHAHS